jgi:SAM-dependent methyltransferase
LRLHKKLFSPRWVSARWKIHKFRAAYEYCPILATNCVSFLETWLQEGDHVLEYGSGSSTPYFASLCERVVSVENDPEWFDRVGSRVSGRDNVERHLFAGTPQPTETGGLVCAEYVDFARTLAAQSFDLILDDGWARAAVAIEGIRLLKPGGLLIFDDNTPETIRAKGQSDQRNTTFLDAVRGWRHVVWDDGVQQTTGFFKPIG